MVLQHIRTSYMGPVLDSRRTRDMMVDEDDGAAAVDSVRKIDSPAFPIFGGSVPLDNR